jgi:RecB family exonuclease
VAGLVYIGLGPTPRVAQVLREGLVAETWAGLHELMRAWADPARGYIARARLERRGDTGDYDHLSRLGEWDEGDPSVPEDVG